MAPLPMIALLLMCISFPAVPVAARQPERAATTATEDCPVTTPPVQLTWHPLDDTSYELLRYSFVQIAEGYDDEVYYDNVGIPTIGVGLNVVTSYDKNGNQLSNVIQDWVIDQIFYPKQAPTATQRTEDLTYRTEAIPQLKKVVGAGLAERDALRTALNAIMIRRAGNTASTYPTKARSFRLPDPQAVRKYVEQVVFPKKEQVISDTIVLPGAAAVPRSRERIALLSMAFNNAGALLGENLVDALTSNNRSRAWCEIRFGSNGGKSRSAGIAARRYAESSLFGLFNDPAQLSAEQQELEARAALRYYARYEVAIRNYDSIFKRVFSSRAIDVTRTYKPVVAVLTTNESYLPALVFFARRYTVDTNTIPSKATPYVGIADDEQQPGQGEANRIDRTQVLEGEKKPPVLNELLLGGLGNDYLNGGAGNDFLLGEEGRDQLVGGSGDDRLFGGADEDLLQGGDDVDVLDGGADNGPDRLEGGPGWDRYLWAPYANGSDTIMDEDHKGTIAVGLSIGAAPVKATSVLDNDYYGGNNTYIGGSGVFVTNLVEYLSIDGTTLTVHPIAQITATLTIEQFKSGDLGINLLSGTCLNESSAQQGSNKPTCGPDRIVGTSGNDTDLAGLEGSDIIDAGDGNDTVVAGSGQDSIDGGVGNDTIDAGPGSDKVDPGSGNDTVDLGSGDDVLEEFDTQLAGDRDTFKGGPGNDRIVSYGRHDKVDGGDGDDEIQATGVGPHADSRQSDSSLVEVTGGDGNDEIIVSDAQATIDAGLGTNSITVRNWSGVEVRIKGGVGDCESKILLDTANFLPLSGFEDALKYTYMPETRELRITPASSKTTGVVIIEDFHQSMFQINLVGVAPAANCRSNIEPAEPMYQMLLPFIVRP